MLLDYAFTQGLDAYPVLAANKDALFKLYFAKPSCVSKLLVLGVTLSVGRGEGEAATPVSATYSSPEMTSTGTTPYIDNTADPIVRIPAAALKRTDGASFTATVQATLQYQYQIKASDTPTTTSAAYTNFPTGSSTPMSRVVEKKTNAIAMLIVKMARGTTLETTHFRPEANDALNRAVNTMSRQLPISSGVSELSGDAGLQRTVNGLLDLDPLSGVLSGGLFCGQGSNFVTVQNGLDGVEGVWNSKPENVEARATTDYSFGAVDQANSSNVAPCVDGMGQLNAWARMLYGTSPDASGSIGTMETVHTMNGVPTNRDGTLNHSPNNLADFGVKQYRTFDVDQGRYVPDCDAASNTNIVTGCARSVMKVSGPIGDWDNAYSPSNPTSPGSTLLEVADQQFVNCRLGGRAGGDCTATQSGTIGTPSAASLDTGDYFVLWGSISGTVATIGESFISSWARPTEAATEGNTWIVFSNGSKFRVPVDDHGSSHTFSAVNILLGTGVFSVIAPLPSGAVGARLCQGPESNPCQTELDAMNASAAPLTIDEASTTPGTGIRKAPGETHELTHTVTPPVDPKTYTKPDIYFLSDTTGSMSGTISAVKNNAGTILSNFQTDHPAADECFGAGDYKDFGDSYAFNNASNFELCGDVDDADRSDATQAAITAWSATGGGDTPEAQFYALEQLATGGADFRDGSERVLIWFGDAPGHDPICASVHDGGSDITETTVKNALIAAGATVMPIDTNDLDGVPDSGYSGCANAGTAGQATRIAEATGGAYTKVAPDQVPATVRKALNNKPATVTHSSSCESGLSILVTPESKTVISGDPAMFDETVTVAPGTTPGVRTCTVDFSINGTPAPALTQTITIDVTTQAGDHNVIAFTADGAEKAHATVDCGDGLHRVLFHSLEPVAGDTFVYDTSWKCPDGGNGAVEVQATNGYTTSSYTVAGTIQADPQSPSGTVLLPEGEYLQYETIPVRLAVQPTDATTTCTLDNGDTVGDGTTQFDLSPPAGVPPLGGWTAGSHVLECELTSGVSSTLEPVSKTFTIAEDKDNDGRKAADEVACIAAGSVLPDLDPTTESRDSNNNFIRNGDESLGQECAPATSSDYQLGAQADSLLFYVSADAFRIRLTSPHMPIKNAVKPSPQITNFGGYDVSSDPGFHALGSTVQGSELVVRFDRQYMINFARANGIGKNGVETVPVEVTLQFQNGSKGHGADMMDVFVPF